MQISVIMPFWNAGQFVDAALRSVFRQSVAVEEVIVVDQGGDTPESAFPDSLRGLDGLRFISSPKVSPAVARNLALAAATGDVITFLDADDLWPLGKLERQVRRLQDHAMVGGYTRWFTETTPEDDLAPAPTQSVELVMSNLGGCVYRKETLDQLGGFDESYLYAEDVDLLLRACESELKIITLRSTELYYRKHSASMMHAADPRREQDFARAAHRSLLRRRDSGGGVRGIHGLASYLEPK